MRGRWVRWATVAVTLAAVAVFVLAGRPSAVRAAEGPSLVLEGLALSIVPVADPKVEVHPEGIVLHTNGPVRFGPPAAIALDELAAGEELDPGDTDTVVNLPNGAVVRYRARLEQGDARAIVEGLTGQLDFAGRRFQVRCVRGAEDDGAGPDPTWCLPHLASLAAVK